MRFALLLLSLCLSCSLPSLLVGQTLEERLVNEGVDGLAAAARTEGDAKRGAVVFHQAYMACSKCHGVDELPSPLGPNLAKPTEKVSDAHLVESILFPSKKMRKGYETVLLTTVRGTRITGLLADSKPNLLILRDVEKYGRLIKVPKNQIDEQAKSAQSVMPKGLVNQLTSRQQFLDLVRYLIEISAGGPSRASDLQPPPGLFAARPLPEYEKRVDHAGLLGDLDRGSFKRGEAIYNRLCVNCHGTVERPGSLPTSLKFASGKFKNGHDPFSMYQTLTRGFGMMAPQTWMVPQQKYDVIHYVRETYLQPHNASQYQTITAPYLAGLPQGDTKGPSPSNIQPWITMDYGPSLTHTYEVGRDGSNFAYKGIAVRLDEGPGGVSRGKYWMVFDEDTLRMAAAWSGDSFIDWNGIMFNGRHAIHPRVEGQVHFANPTGPGWADPQSGQFDDPRFRGRDDRPYGPLPRKWARYRGLYHHGDRVVISYTVGRTDVYESPAVEPGETPLFKRTFNLGPRRREMILQVARHDERAVLQSRGGPDGSPLAIVAVSDSSSGPQQERLRFDGATSVTVAKPQDFDLTNRDFSIVGRIKTKSGGTLFCKGPVGKWAPDGKSLFVRGGRLVFDIGWVGQVASRATVNDGKPHDVAMTWQSKSGRVRLYVDGELSGEGRLKPKRAVPGQSVRLGYTSPNFPRPASFYKGQLDYLAFYQRELTPKELPAAKMPPQRAKDLRGFWRLDEVNSEQVADASGKGHGGRVARGLATSATSTAAIVAGLSRDIPDARWEVVKGDLRLRIPAGDEPLRFTLWTAKLKDIAQASALGVTPVDEDLAKLTQGGPTRYPQVITTQPTIGDENGPFAVDVLTRPAANPWLCRVRLTGLDFFPDGKRAIACDWDGDIWSVTSLDQPEKGLQWRRIGSGMFQPLGVKIVDGTIYVTCRDQLCVLRDLNGDGETDFYENFNNDHQVTEHFHEFAMGLQTDREGNFYYAKSARHALPALVPHHGTLLKVTKDGQRTDIIATGFRAANGVCINPDGTFIVTDQEGHWNPKNRINWVRPGGFYGNMFGYHDITDSSDGAMEQPLCWITNAFDRSPSELLWVESEAWGPFNGSLLNFSYGYGKIYVVPHEQLNGQMQGGMCALPIPQFPTGVMRGRFHPVNGQLYACGMFAWAGNQQQPGGLYRVRYTGKAAHLPLGLSATDKGMTIRFSEPVDQEFAADIKSYAVKTWSLKRTANYGSKHFDEKRLAVSAVNVSADGKSVTLQMPGIRPTWSMEIKYSIRGSKGEAVRGVVHNTIHKLGR